jgi:hypothetical protein
MSKSAVLFLKSRLKSLFENDESGHYSKLFSEAEAKEETNIKEAFNAGNQDNYYDATGKAAEKYWRG